MKIKINGKEVEVSGERPLIEELKALGIETPSMCYAEGAEHQASCMVCMVKNQASGQMIPSCSTYPVEGMDIDSESEDVQSLRRLSLELLLSDHRADCEAPCTVVCPHHLDVAQLILYYDRGQMAEAHALLASTFDVAALPCEDCKAGCEKACRRGTVDSAVAIRDIVREVAAYKPNQQGSYVSNARTGKDVFTSRLGRYTDAEKEWLKEVYSQQSRCLHCACEGRGKCKLREYATQAGIKTPRYGVSSSLPVKENVHVVAGLHFEPAKCIRCGLCVYNTNDGFTFQNRGFNMQVVIPEESKAHVSEQIAKLCPTGALYVYKVRSNK
ncbi:MAG: 2Fe-2S iron-sulfur cluster-binding protein [Bacteroidaceae bacterium]|nr:2Fe-2S iron-sulfur cluster-binding protein [Bacteroidaceae bacterium]